MLCTWVGLLSSRVGLLSSQGWAYFRVKGGPTFESRVGLHIFGRGVLENTPIPLFEQPLSSSSAMGVFSRDYGMYLSLMMDFSVTGS